MISAFQNLLHKSCLQFSAQMFALNTSTNIFWYYLLGYSGSQPPEAYQVKTMNLFLLSLKRVCLFLNISWNNLHSLQWPHYHRSFQALDMKNYINKMHYIHSRQHKDQINIIFSYLEQSTVAFQRKKSSCVANVLDISTKSVPLSSLSSSPSNELSF